MSHHHLSMMINYNSHQFSNMDIEISAFITSIISWGNKSIIKSSKNIMAYMDNSPTLL